MTTCRECKASISTKADTCPQCGARVRRTSLLTKLVLAVILIGVVGAVWSEWYTARQKDAAAQAESARRAALTVEQRAAEEKRRADAAAAAAKAKAASEAAFQKAVVVAKAVKAGAKDPSSLEFIDAFVTDSGAVALQFRAKNSFGALVINYAVVAPDGKALSGSQQDVASLWNKHIAKAKGVDVTKAIRGAVSLGAI